MIKKHIHVESSNISETVNILITYILSKQFSIPVFIMHLLSLCSSCISEMSLQTRSGVQGFSSTQLEFKVQKSLRSESNVSVTPHIINSSTRTFVLKLSNSRQNTTCLSASKILHLFQSINGNVLPF